MSAVRTTIAECAIRDAQGGATDDLGTLAERDALARPNHSLPEEAGVPYAFGTSGPSGRKQQEFAQGPSRGSSQAPRGAEPTRARAARGLVAGSCRSRT